MLSDQAARSDRHAGGHPRNPFTYRGEAGASTGQGREKRRSVTFLTQAQTQTQRTSSQKPRNNSDALASAMDAISRHSPSASPRRGLHNGLTRDADDGAGESSADEETAIVRRRDNASQANYGAVTVDDDDAHQHDQLNGCEVLGERSPKQRKSGSLRSSLRGSNRNGRLPARNQHESHPAASEHNGQDSNGWFKGLIENYGSVELENKGSVARDHLALGEFVLLFRNHLNFRPAIIATAIAID